MTAQEHLSNYGVSMEIANDFIMNNLNNLSGIHEVCKSYGITTNMIAEIITYGGLEVTGTDVANFFASNGIDSDDLGGTAKSISVTLPEVVNTPVVSGVQGNSTLDNLLSSNSYVILYENVSKELVDSFTAYDQYGYSEFYGFDFMYGSNDTWNGISSLGFAPMDYYNYSNIGYEVDYNSTGTIAIGIDMAQYNDLYGSLLEDYGMDLDYAGIANVTGNYDLLVAY